MKDEELKDLIRYKLSETEFPFDESNWERAEAKINSFRAQQKRRRFAAIFLSAGLIGAITWMLLPPDTTEEKMVLNTLPSNSSSLETSNGAVTTKKINREKQQLDGSVAYPASVEKTPAKGNQPAARKFNAASIGYYKHKKDLLLPLNADPIVKLNSIIGKSKEDIPVAIEEPIGKNQVINNPDYPALAIDNEASKVDEQADPIIVENKTTEGMTVDDKKQGEENELKVVTLSATDTLEEIVETDTANELKELPAAEAITDQRKTINEHFLTLEAGGSYTLGWSYGNSKDGAGITPLAGVSVTQTIDKWAGNAGIFFNSIGHMNMPGHIATMTEYGFGTSTQTITIRPKTIYYLAVPLKVFYLFNNKHAVGLGCNSAFLMNTRSEVETYDDATDQPQKYFKKGYMDGFKPFEFQLTTTYKREFAGLYGVSAELFYGLTDVKNNTFFRREDFERNTGFKLTIYYNIKNNRP